MGLAPLYMDTYVFLDYIHLQFLPKTNPYKQPKCEIKIIQWIFKNAFMQLNMKNGFILSDSS